ncbi:hypothetical protein MFLAVUS_009665 [Mucor flavus]|uniref:Uncharacterized protein n=1 Tax=Mucor flavus TaxID=439312 RepID=A0ABP9ZAI6_9FUNG
MSLNDITNNTSSNDTVKRKRLADYELGMVTGHYESGLMPAAIGRLASAKSRFEPDQKHLGNLRSRRGSTTNVERLTAALKEKWPLLDVDYLETLVSRMGRRCQAVIEAEGSITKN